MAMGKRLVSHVKLEFASLLTVIRALSPSCIVNSNMARPLNLCVFNVRKLILKMKRLVEHTHDTNVFSCCNSITIPKTQNAAL